MMHMTKKGIYGAVLMGMATVLVAVGCGGSGEAETLTRFDFVKQANAICSSAQSEREEALEQATEGNAKPEKKALVTEVILPTIQQMAEELEDLGRPKDDEKEVQAIVSAFEGGVQKVEANAGADLAADVAAFSHADELAQEYGLTECRI
jgi:hypothetical protein